MFDLKRFNNLSREQLLEVVTRSYRNNCAAFVTDFTHLFEEGDGTIFKPYEKQIHIMNLLDPNDRIIVVLKCRQSGISTAAAVARTFHNTFFGKNPDNVVISSTKVQSLKIMRRIKQCFDELPEFLKPKMVVDTAQEILLSNKSRAISLSSNPHQAKGWTGEQILDEFASFTERESREIYTAVYPTTTKGGKIIAISTPLGNMGMFHDLATKSLSEISGTEVKFESKKFFIHWQDCPYIVKAVNEDGLFDGMDNEAREQEYELKFVDANLEQQFFPKDFILETLREKDAVDLPLYTSYTELGIPIQEFIGDRCENLEKPLPLHYFKTDELRERYDKIVGGYDVASTSNDSIVIVDGRLRGKYDKWEEIGYFKVNRVNNRMHDLIFQAQYVKRIIQCMDLDYLNCDENGLGQAVVEYMKKDKDIGKKINGFKLGIDDKYRAFVFLKQMFSEQRNKRRWEENNLTRDMLKQYTNLQLNMLNNSLKAKGILKDDAPYAKMLIHCTNGYSHSNILFI